MRSRLPKSASYEMKPGVPCHFRGEGSCTYRPDRLGVMIVATKWRGRPAYILKSAGRDPDEPLLRWMRAFSVERGATFFYEQAGGRFGFGPPQFQHEMLAKLESGERLW